MNKITGKQINSSSLSVEYDREFRQWYVENLQCEKERTIQTRIYFDKSCRGRSKALYYAWEAIKTSTLWKSDGVIPHGAQGMRCVGDVVEK